MHYVIYAGGIPFDGDTINTRALGGSETAAYYVGRELAARGHRVVMFTEIDHPSTKEGVLYQPVGQRTQKHPLGTNWHFYVEHTPHDVNIIQRVPSGFYFANQAKVNLWWTHDLATSRARDAVTGSLWQIDRIMPVSNWFKDQIVEVWDVEPSIVSPIHNGVDYELFERIALKDNSVESPEIKMIYCSRPERGLENLVAPGGIMEQLAEKAPHIKLEVCGYDHKVDPLEGYYAFLRERIDELPNCEHIGSLTKQALAEKMCTDTDIWCYPTEFEEVSCITAMEAMAAGLYIMTTDTGALRETIGSYTNCSIYRYKDSEEIVKKFVDTLSKWKNKFRRKPLRPYPWARAVDEIEEIVDDCFECAWDVDALARHYLRHSDIMALHDLIWGHDIDPAIREEVRLLYDFALDGEKFAEHYAQGTERMYNGPDFKYESEEFINHPRFSVVNDAVSKLPEGARILDYGCAHGHFTNYLAKLHPDKHFTGIDVSPEALEIAERKSVEMGLQNVAYARGDWYFDSYQREYDVDLVILGEVLEHVANPIRLVDKVYMRTEFREILITTPFGPWEAETYVKHYPKRYHLHHFERDDLVWMFGDNLDFDTVCMAAGHNSVNEIKGWYITTFSVRDDSLTLRKIDYHRKHRAQAPRQTVSYCGIVKDGEIDFPRLFRSIEPWVDEVVVGVDKNTTDSTRSMLHWLEADCARKTRSPYLPFTVIDIDSPIDVGFDTARNEVLKHCTKQWVLWADSDEEFVGGERLPKYLRRNQWRGYGVAQHHFSVEPTRVLSTDYPVRLFRRDEDIRFHGVVHEHPESVHTPNEGVGRAFVVHELHFSHLGYKTEEVRRRRFMRNVNLMARDRQENPDRLLGRFLWIRDLALMCRFELEQSGNMVSEQMQARAISGLRLWEETLDQFPKHPQVQRMVRDHLEFYDTLVNVLDHGFEFRMRLSSGFNGATPPLEATPEISARFYNKRHLDKFLSVVIDSEVSRYETKY